MTELQPVPPCCPKLLHPYCAVAGVETAAPTVTARAKKSVRSLRIAILVELKRNAIRNTRRLKFAATRQPSQNCAGFNRSSGLPPSRFPVPLTPKRDGALNSEPIRNIDFEWPEQLHDPVIGKSQSESYADTNQRIAPLNSRECDFPPRSCFALVAGVGRLSICKARSSIFAAAVLSPADAR